VGGKPQRQDAFGDAQAEDGEQDPSGGPEPVLAAMVGRTGARML